MSELKILGVFLMLAAIAGGAWKIHDAGWDAGRAALLNEQAEAAAKRQLDAAAAAHKSAAKKLTTRQLERALDQEVTRYVATDAARADCFDDNGMLIFNAVGQGMPVPDGRPAVVPGDSAASPPSNAR